MLIHLLATAGGDDRRWLVDYLQAAPSGSSGGGACRVYDLMTRYGSLAYARDYAAGDGGRGAPRLQ